MRRKSRDLLPKTLRILGWTDAQIEAYGQSLLHMERDFGPEAGPPSEPPSSPGSTEVDVTGPPVATTSEVTDGEGT